MSKKLGRSYTKSRSTVVGEGGERRRRAQNTFAVRGSISSSVKKEKEYMGMRFADIFNSVDEKFDYGSESTKAERLQEVEEELVINADT